MYYVLFVFAMLTPVLMAVVGLIWRIHPPKRDGGFLAYRTALSSKTEETWAFAHRPQSPKSGRASDSAPSSPGQVLRMYSTFYTSFLPPVMQNKSLQSTSLRAHKHPAM